MKAQSVEEVNTAIAKTGKRALLRHDPSGISPGFYFVNVCKSLRAHKIDVTSVSDLTVEQWLMELEITEVKVTLDAR